MAYQIRSLPYVKPFSRFPLKLVHLICLLLMSVITANRVKMNNNNLDQHLKLCNMKKNRFYVKDMASW